MKIILFSETLLPGGAELFAVRMANMFCTDHEVGFVVLYENKIHRDIISRLSPSVTRYILKLPFLRLFQRIDRMIWKLGIDFSFVQRKIISDSKRYVEEFKPDIVHGHLFNTDYILAEIKRVSKHQFLQVATIHGDYSSFYNRETFAQVLNIKGKMKATLSALDAIVCLCDEHVKFFKHHFPSTANKLFLVYNGYIPFDREYLHKSRRDMGILANAFVFGMVSRGIQKKGWSKIIEAFVNANMPNACLVLVGSGDYLQELAKANENPKIIFTGFSSNPLEYIQHFNVGILPTLFRFESLPTVIMEYLYCEKPVIATDVGEIRTMLTDKNSDVLAGDLLPFINNTIDAKLLSSLMERYYFDQAYLLEKQKYAKPAFNKFDIDYCKDLYLDIYNRMLLNDL